MHDPTSRSWRVSATKGDRPVFLYTVTTDAMVQIDLSLPKFASLIESARRIILSNRTAEHNHIDLATGAFIEYVRKKEYASTRALHVEPAEHSPMSTQLLSRVDLVEAFFVRSGKKRSGSRSKRLSSVRLRPGANRFDFRTSSCAIDGTCPKTKSSEFLNTPVRMRS